jgi:5-methylcytosine-specific restriction endonuclease McrA
MTDSKYCPRCKTTKPAADFARNRTSKDGLHSYCRPCHAAYYQENKTKVSANQKAYYEANKVEILKRDAERRKKKDKAAIKAYNQDYRQKNAERLREHKRQYYLKNRKEINEKAKEYREKDPDKWNAYLREYHRRNRDKILSKHKEYWQETKAERNKKQREYQKAHPESIKASKHNRKARIRGNGGTFRAAEWRNLKASYQNTCLCCGRTEPEIKLVPDHVIPLALGGKNEISNLQPLCGECNQSKGIQTTDYRPANNKPSQ